LVLTVLNTYKKAVSTIPVEYNVKHDTIAIVNNKTYLTKWFKSVLYALDTLWDLSD